MPVPGMKCDGKCAVAIGEVLIFCQLLLRTVLVVVLLSGGERAFMFGVGWVRDLVKGEFWESRIWRRWG